MDEELYASVFGKDDTSELTTYRKCKIPVKSLSRFVRKVLKDFITNDATLNGKKSIPKSSIEIEYGEDALQAAIG